MRWLILLLPLTLFCKPQQKISERGVAIARVIFFDQQTNTYRPIENVMPAVKIWFQDSMMIQKISKPLWEEFDDGRPTKRWIEHIGYTFIDIRTHSFYHYKTFSDTAMLVGKWFQPDSVSINDYGGGWNIHYRHNWASRSFVPLKDTLKDGYSYKRLLFMNVDSSSNPSVIAYFRCDIKPTILQIEKDLCKKIGCTLVRFEQIPTTKNPHAMGSEIIYERDHLTVEELKVFAAWEKNAKENPVNK